MAHMIDFSRGYAAIAYSGEKPWHNLGFELPKGKSLEVWCEKAGLDWEAKQAPVAWVDEKKVMHESASDIVLYRSDTKDQLSVVGKDFKVVQPKAVIEFFRELVEDNGGFHMEVAGSLDGGRKVWALARREGEIRIMGQDLLLPYLLLATGLDGSMKTTAQFTTVRVVCNNTLQASLGEKSVGSVRVSHRSLFDQDAVKAQLGLKADDAFKAFEEETARMAKKKISREDAVSIFVRALAGDGDVDLDDKDLQRKVGTLLSAYEKGPGSDLKSAKGTAWGVMNAVTFVTDHAARARSGNNRLRDAWFGRGADLKARVSGILMAEAA